MSQSWIDRDCGDDRERPSLLKYYKANIYFSSVVLNEVDSKGRQLVTFFFPTCKQVSSTHLSDRYPLSLLKQVLEA